jgi:hypothetical protein
MHFPEIFGPVIFEIPWPTMQMEKRQCRGLDGMLSKQFKRYILPILGISAQRSHYGNSFLFKLKCNFIIM